jgi:hypothetical protein
MSRGKLVRDKIPEIIRANGEMPSTRIAKGMNPDRKDAAEFHVRSWPITKRLVDLRYSASARTPHRGKRQELLLTTLPPSCAPLGDRFQALS